MRHVIDTCVVVSALRSKRGASNRVLHLVLEGQLLAVCHYKLLAEYHDVLIAWSIKSGSLTFSERQVERFLGALVCEEVEVRYLWRPNLRDEGDNFVYEAAFAASPSTIVTHNLRDFRKPELDWPGVFVKTPRQVLKEVSGNA